MSLLSTQSLLLSPTGSHDTARPNSAGKQNQGDHALKTKGSLANLIHFARNPFENASEVVEDWLDGSTKQERAEKQAVEDRKQLLYLKLRNVILMAYPISML